MANGDKRNAPRAVLVGLGLDSDGHKRLTRGDNFLLAGGTAETHAEMTEMAVKINEKLSARGRRLETVTCEEFDDIAREAGLRRASIRRASSET